MTGYSFNPGQNQFFKDLKNRVEAYFKVNKLHTSGEWKLYFKGLLQISTALALYLTLVFFTPVVPISILLCLILGVNMAVVGFNVMHEGGHQTFSRFKWLNQVAAYFLNVLGGSIYFWKRKHNINHHTYTNIEGMDSDIDVKPFMRLHAAQPLRWYHRFQHVYWVVLYGLSYLVWIFHDDFQKYFRGEITPTSGKKPLPVREHVAFWMTKLGYLGLYVAVPIFMVGWLPWLIGFAIVTFTCGLAISIVFQLAHVVEVTEFHTTDVGEPKSNWAVHQLASTSNFATSSKTLFWLLGGLNFQVEHHLFPRVSHIHYPRIRQLIRETCEEYNIIYHEHKTMFQAIVSHLMLLRRLGKSAG